jgi:hypothetical protein
VQSNYELLPGGEFQFVAENLQSGILALEGELLYTSGSSLLKFPMAA